MSKYKFNTMNCKNFKNNIFLHLEGGLTGSESVAFNNHLNECQKCNELYQNISSTISLFPERENINVDMYFYTRLKQRMENKLSKNVFGIFTRRILQPLIVSSFVIIGIIIGNYIGNHYIISYTNNNEDIRNVNVKAYAEENYIVELNNDNYEVLLTSNQ